jgi:hypothetical protein
MARPTYLVVLSALLAMMVMCFPAGAAFESATFHFYATQYNGQTVNVHRITAPWVETEVTWNNFGSAYDPSVASSFVSDRLGWNSVDVTSLVEGWLHGTYENYGFLLDQVDFTYPRSCFYSRDNFENQPYLEICYTTPGGTECDETLPVADAYIYELFPDTNYGERLYLCTGWDHPTDLEKQSLVKFDIIPKLAAIGDYVWNDENMDGIQDTGEEGISDVPVNLYDCMDSLIASTTTGNDGFYLFNNLTPGDYYVEFIAPSGYFFSPPDQGGDDERDSDADPATGKTICTTLEAGESQLRWDAGLYMEECGDCDGGVIELTLRYFGSNPAYVQVYDGKRPKPDRLLYEDTVAPDESFTFTGQRPDGTMGANISLFVDGEFNTTIHTSCSQPIGPGLIRGYFEVISGYSKYGGLLCPISEYGWCELGKPMVLTMRYTGQSCEFTNHDQDPDQVECEGDPAGASPVMILATDRERYDHPKTKTWFYGQVEIDSTFDIDARNAGASRLRGNTYVFIFDLDGNLLQYVKFHTSCSQPLNEGNQFGSLVLEGFIPEG